MEFKSVGIKGLGYYVPEKVMTNFDFEKIIDTSDEWIRTRTGIEERRFAAPEQATSDLCVEAAKKAIGYLQSRLPSSSYSLSCSK